MVRGWRAIPPELGVPIAMTAVITACVRVIDHPMGYAFIGWPARWASSVLVLCGLRELRRRVPGARTALTVAVVAKTLTVCVQGSSFASPAVAPTLMRDWAWVVELLLPVAAAVVVIALITAARCWRSWPTLALLVTLPLAEGVLVLLRPLVDLFGTGTAFALAISLAVVVHAGALLAVVARLGTAGEPDLARAVAAARRARWSWRIRAGVFAIAALWLLALDATELLGLGLFVLIVQNGLFASAMLGLGRARIAGLHGTALAAAAYGAVWATAFASSLFWIVRGRIDGLPIAPAGTVPLVSLIVAGWVVRTYVAQGGDRARDLAVLRRLAGLIVAAAAVMALGSLGEGSYAALVALPFAELAAALALASLYRILTERLALAEATDAF
jgi:hypothetical protein